MGYYSGNKIDIINNLAGEIESSLEQIKEGVNFLEAVDWNEIFEHVPNSESIQSQIEDAINDIASALINVEN